MASAWRRCLSSAAAAVLQKDPTRPGIIQRRPTTPSNRHTALIDRSALFKGRPLKALTRGLPRTGGRNNHGHTTVWHRGGRHKRLYRFVDLARRNVIDSPARVTRIEYDPNRSSFIALLKHPPSLADALEATPAPAPGEKGPAARLPKNRAKFGRYSYVLCPQGIRVGSILHAASDSPVDPLPGNAAQLKHLPIGTNVFNIELHPGKGGQMCRAAGTSAQLLEKDHERGLALLRLASKEIRFVRWECMATVGAASNPEHKNQRLGKAGRARWKGRRPHVRGVAMNPVDHPHGGGEGKTSGGRPSCTPWGVPTKGYRTVLRRKSNPLIVRRRYE